MTSTKVEPQADLVRIPRTLKPWDNTEKEALSIGYGEFRGFGKPQETTGDDGDIYIDLTPKAHVLYAKTLDGWTKWPGPKERHNHLAHPHYTQRFLWCSTQGSRIGWVKAKAIKKVIATKTASEIIIDILAAQTKEEAKKRKPESSLKAGPSKKARVSDVTDSSSRTHTEEKAGSSKKARISDATGSPSRTHVEDQSPEAASPSQTPGLPLPHVNFRTSTITVSVPRNSSNSGVNPNASSSSPKRISKTPSKATSRPSTSFNDSPIQIVDLSPLVATPSTQPVSSKRPRPVSPLSPKPAQRTASTQPASNARASTSFTTDPIQLDSPPHSAALRTENDTASTPSPPSPLPASPNVLKRPRATESTSTEGTAVPRPKPRPKPHPAWSTASPTTAELARLTVSARPTPNARASTSSNAGPVQLETPPLSAALLANKRAASKSSIPPSSCPPPVHSTPSVALEQPQASGSTPTKRRELSQSLPPFDFDNEDPQEDMLVDDDMRLPDSTEDEPLASISSFGSLKREDQEGPPQSGLDVQKVVEHAKRLEEETRQLRKFITDRGFTFPQPKTEQPTTSIGSYVSNASSVTAVNASANNSANAAPSCSSNARVKSVSRAVKAEEMQLGVSSRPSKRRNRPAAPVEIIDLTIDDDDEIMLPPQPQTSPTQAPPSPAAPALVQPPPNSATDSKAEDTDIALPDTPEHKPSLVLDIPRSLSIARRMLESDTGSLPTPPPEYLRPITPVEPDIMDRQVNHEDPSLLITDDRHTNSQLNSIKEEAPGPLDRVRISFGHADDSARSPMRAGAKSNAPSPSETHLSAQRPGPHARDGVANDPNSGDSQPIAPGVDVSVVKEETFEDFLLLSAEEQVLRIIFHKITETGKIICRSCYNEKSREYIGRRYASNTSPRVLTEHCENAHPGAREFLLKKDVAGRMQITTEVEAAARAGRHPS